MAQKLGALRGMEDILPGEVEKWQWVEEKARVFFESCGFKEIRTPLLEYTDLFSRSVGEASDIIHKEMFSFEDRGGRQITLRPEMTASVARAVIEHGLLKTNKSLRLYYIGPMFRAERPQAGRKRQFHQIGVEIINETNSGGFNVDFDVVFLLCSFLRYAGLKNFKLRLNDLGSFDQQKEMTPQLKQYFSRELSKLCPDCRYRLEKNVLRIFDCKNESCQPIINKVPWNEIAPLSKEFEYLISCIQSGSIPFEVDRRLVRGLDYYNHAVFEVSAEGLGAQNAIAGGGRYDHLFEDLGGTKTPCTGFSLGMERLLEAIEKSSGKIADKFIGYRVYLAPLEENFKVQEIVKDLGLKLREKGYSIELDLRETSLSKHLKQANKAAARFVLILGSEEIKKGIWTVKDMKQKIQTEIKEGDILSYLHKELGL
ncbi:MAG: histidine--tRNA ligase [Candidatus Omnitrophica bacterium]|nr:histidine--tRNA ligase [Candidatus Omnitrophota bacterium]